MTRTSLPDGEAPEALRRVLGHPGLTSVREDLLLAMFGPDAVAKLLAMPPGALDAAYDAQMAIPLWTIRANGTLPSFTDLDGHLHVGQWLSPQELDAYFSGLDAGLK